jgi:hypothetical protein
VQPKNLHGHVCNRKTYAATCAAAKPARPQMRPQTYCHRPAGFSRWSACPLPEADRSRKQAWRDQTTLRRKIPENCAPEWKAVRANWSGAPLRPPSTGQCASTLRAA